MPSKKSKKKKKQTEKLADEMMDQFSELHTAFSKASDAEKLAMLQKKSFQLRKEGKIKEAKEIQNLIKEDHKLSHEVEEQEKTMILGEILRQMKGVPEPYRTDDGDQTPVHGFVETQKLKMMWAGGMNWNPNNPGNSQWLLNLTAGNYSGMMSIIKETPDDEIKGLVERRETLLNLSAIFHVIKGSTLVNEVTNKFEKKWTFVDQTITPQHLVCFTKLIQLGANLNARDFAGFTPLHHCVTRYGNSTTYHMAKLLLENGADPNAKNRLGETALVQPMLSKELHFIRLLVENGTDPSIKDNVGVSCIGMASMDRQINRIFADARKKDSRKVRETAKKQDGLLSCVACKKTSSQRCTGCYVARYCSKECQLAHWKEHKSECAKNKDLFVPVNLLDESDMSIVNISFKGGKATAIGKNTKPEKKNFIVKIQVPRPMGPPLGKTPTDPLLLYDEKKNIYGGISSNESIYNPLLDIIESKGVQGLKGYFYAIVDKDDKLRINIRDIQLPRDW